MSVYKPEGRKYYVVDFILNGKRVKKSTKRTTKKEAERVEMEERRKILDAVQLGELETITVREAVDEWYRHYGSKLKDAHRIANEIGIMFGEGKSERTDRAYNRQRVWTWDGKKKLHDLTNGDLKTFINMRFSEGVAVATIISEMNVMRRTVNRLKGVYMTPTLQWPSSREDKRLVPNKKSRFLSKEEIADLFRELDPNRKISRWPDADYRNASLQQDLQDAHDLAMFILHTGCRPDEAMSLMWSDVNLDTRRLQLQRSKLGAAQWTGLVMSARLVELLKRRAEGASSPYVFPDRRSGGPRKQCRAIQRAMDRAGLNEEWKVKRYGGKATMYTLRDTYASQLAQSGKHSIQEIQHLLGHKEVKTTMKYARLVPDRVSQAAAETLDALEF